MKRAAEPKPKNQPRVVKKLYKQRHVYLGWGDFLGELQAFLLHRNLLLYSDLEPCTVREEGNLYHNHVVVIYCLFFLVISISRVLFSYQH